MVEFSNFLACKNILVGKQKIMETKQPQVENMRSKVKQIQIQCMNKTIPNYNYLHMSKIFLW